MTSQRSTQREAVVSQSTAVEGEGDRERTDELAAGEILPSAAERSLAERLLSDGLLEPDGLKRARAMVRTGTVGLPMVLTRLGLVAEEDLSRILAEQLDRPVARARDYPDMPLFPELLSPRFLRDVMVVPLTLAGDALVLAMADPFDDYACRAVAVAVSRRVVPWPALPTELETALNRLYPEAEDRSGGDGDADRESDVSRLRDRASEAPVVRFVNQLIDRAVAEKASDIHIEPEAHALSVRFRVDGQLRAVKPPPRPMEQALLSRLKLMAKLDIAERRLPQDGQIRLASGGHEVDLRIATMPALHGESMVIRLLNRAAVPLDLKELGYGEDAHAAIRALLKKRQGIILATGPTGSGKTTTLYTALRMLTAPERKLISVEDPVEYHLPGITQIQVKPAIGLGFADVLRSILRHDPDIIMIGEIRDPETAEIAVQAALTGHLVLSTLHTNDAVTTIHRLLDMGIEDYLLAPTLAGVVAQRLVRRLCPDCRVPAADAADWADRLQSRRSLEPGPVLYGPGGCDRCGGTGYRGRLAVAEVLTPTDRLRQLVFDQATPEALEQEAVASGMRRLWDDAVDKALAGLTSIDEILPLGMTDALP